jgi:hypothetical protein
MFVTHIEDAPMNLAEFVDESLTEILAGIRAAQKKEGGGEIGAEFVGATEKGLLVTSGSSQFTVVDFDVSVVAGRVAKVACRYGALGLKVKRGELANTRVA